MVYKYLATLAVGLLAGELLAQVPAEPLAFEVATVKAAPPIQEIIQQIQAGKAGRLGMTINAARVDMGFQSLADLIRMAYRVKPYQVQGPEWMAQQRFEIQAKIPDGVSPDKVPEMLQALLADRFKLTVHRGTKELPVYALIVGKNGSKLIPASTEEDAPLPDSPGGLTLGTEKGQVKIAQDGKGNTVMQGGGRGGTIKQSISAAGLHLEMTKTSIESMVELLGSLVDRPVVDMTGLTGTYQVALDLPMEDVQIIAQKQAAALGISMPRAGGAGANAADSASTPSGAAIFGAVEKLGLKLDARKAPVETIVVDHLEKTPTDN